ncbi:class I SAM-dependent methyltransferase [Streptosporangium roseum]|uniref:class I SAM-dependent methyltransferase n=1 Tax=Streptosporangium roseum TaxID=2001 RepID=UPI00331AE5AB
MPELQVLARQVAVDRAWGPDLAQVVQALFDEQAATWNAEHSVGRFDPVEDALRRGRIRAGGVCLEVGSGTGQITALLAGRFEAVVCVDLSADMLAQVAAGRGHDDPHDLAERHAPVARWARTTSPHPCRIPAACQARFGVPFPLVVQTDVIVRGSFAITSRKMA